MFHFPKNQKLCNEKAIERLFEKGKYFSEKPLIETTLHLFRGNQIKAAKCLGFNRNTLRSKIKLYGIEVIKKRKV